jgi:hypothetical protein
MPHALLPPLLLPLLLPLSLLLPLPGLACSDFQYIL